MGDSNMNGKGFDSTECTMAAPKNSSLMGDDMVCTSFNDIYKNANQSEAACYLPENPKLLKQLADAQAGIPGVCEAPTHEKRGPVEVTTDEYGEMFEVKDNNGNTFTKRSDGKWARHTEIGTYKSDEVVENVKVDEKGNLSYDYNRDEDDVHVHFEKNADGSHSATNNFGKFAYDKDNQLVEAPSGEGRIRKFHYTDGQLDQIDGNLGHWDRVQKDGQVSWVNKDSGAVWAGDFRVNIASNILEYRGQNGAAWAFTPWGTDVPRTDADK